MEENGEKQLTTHSVCKSVQTRHGATATSFSSSGFAWARVVLSPRVIYLSLQVYWDHLFTTGSLKAAHLPKQTTPQEKIHSGATQPPKHRVHVALELHDSFETSTKKKSAPCHLSTATVAPAVSLVYITSDKNAWPLLQGRSFFFK